MEPCGCHGGTMALILWALSLNFSSGDLTSTSSYMCGSWYLPIFLFRDGSFTLINSACLMILAMLWSSLPTMLKLSIDNSLPVMLWWSWMGDGAFMCSLNLSPNGLPDSPIYSSSQSTLPHLKLYITPLFCRMVSLSLGCTRRSLMVLPPLKNILPHVFCGCFCSSHPCLGCLAQLYRTCCYCQFCWCYWLSLD